MHRFFVPPEAIRQGQVRFPKPAARQMARVLRLRPGDMVAVLDGRGSLYRVILQRVERDEAVGRVVEREDASGEPRVSLALYAALIKGSRFEWIVQKGTELGVARFVPMVTERTVVRDLPLSSHRMARWERIAQEAAEQCGRARVPQIVEPVTFAAACQQAATADLGLIGWAGESRRSLASLFTDRPGDVALLIGPEGGFTPEEVALARAQGLLPFSLGPRTLRAETAAIVAVTLVMYHAGELAPPGVDAP